MKNIYMYYVYLIAILLYYLVLFCSNYLHFSMDLQRKSISHYKKDL